MRLAGTASMYSIPASSHEIRITQPSGRALATSGPPLRCQYHATVMNTFDRVSSTSVGMRALFARCRSPRQQAARHFHFGDAGPRMRKGGGIAAAALVCADLGTVRCYLRGPQLVDSEPAVRVGVGFGFRLGSNRRV